MHLIAATSTAFALLVLVSCAPTTRPLKKAGHVIAVRDVHDHGDPIDMAFGLPNVFGVKVKRRPTGTGVGVEVPALFGFHYQRHAAVPPVEVVGVHGANSGSPFSQSHPLPPPDNVASTPAKTPVRCQLIYGED